MPTFALVHGAYHGGWCWELVVPELQARGWATVAPDMPCDDADAGLGDYAQVVVDALEGHDDVVLVGHSLGSLVIPLVAARRPARRMIFLCSVPTGAEADVGKRLSGMVRPGFYAAKRFVDDAGRDMLSNQDSCALFFDDCPEDVALRAAARLRPQGPGPLSGSSPLTQWPDVPSSVVLTADDRVVDLAWAQGTAREFTGHEPALLRGSHSPFLSRPTELAEVLVAEADRRPGAPATA